MGGAHTALEHAEHIEHAGHGGGLGSMIALTMAIIAALLAVVTMMGHRSHNETLLYHSDANRLQTQSNVLHTRASDIWNFYQAKKIRVSECKAFLQMLPVFAKDGTSEAAEAARKDWAGIVTRYEGDGKDELKDLKSQAEAKVKEAESLSEQSIQLLEKGERSHARSTRFDLGELGVEMGVVLCSVAVLSQSRKFWAAAIASAALGLLVALTGWLNLFMGEPHEGGGQEGGAESAEHATPAGGEHSAEKAGEKPEHDAATK